MSAASVGQEAFALPEPRLRVRQPDQEDSWIGARLPLHRVKNAASLQSFFFTLIVLLIKSLPVPFPLGLTVTAQYIQATINHYDLKPPAQHTEILGLRRLPNFSRRIHHFCLATFRGALSPSPRAGVLRKWRPR